MPNPDHKEGTSNDGTSCHLVVNGTIIIFGGSLKRQISIIYPFGIKRISTLPFDFEGGRCNINKGTITLCFDFAKPSLCRFRQV